MEHIYIMLSATNSMLSTAIGVVTKKKYNHISISFDKELDEVYSFGRLNPNNPFSGGFSREQVTSNFYLKAECQIYELEVTREQFKKIRAIIDQYDKNKHYYYYNLLGLITAWLNIPWDRPDAYFCSEFVSTVLIESDVLDKSLIPSVTRPHDIINNLDLALYFEGHMWQYKLKNLPLGYLQRLKDYVQVRIT